MQLAARSDALLDIAMSAFVLLALCAALVLMIVSLRRPSTVPLTIAGGLIVVALLATTVTHWHAPAAAALPLALLGVAVAVVGGNPLTRRVLGIASSGRVRETDDGGILVPPAEGADPDAAARPMLRGGTVIGHLERLGVALAIIAGYPEAIAVIVAVKGVGRFTELAEPEARERFIVGTLASLLWAGMAGALVRLAIA